VPLWLLTPLACLAGLAALFQLALQGAFLGFEFGATAATESTILAAFMAGCGLGAFVAARVADGVKRPLLPAGVLQLVLGGLSLGLPAIRGAVGVEAGLLPISLALALAPGILTGATIVFLVRAGAHTTDRASVAWGALFGAFAVGGAAALPVLASMRSSGLEAGAAGSFAGIAHLALGAILAGLSAPVGARDTFVDAEGLAVTAQVRTPATGDAGRSVLLALAALGVAIPLQRFAWGRVLPLANGAVFMLHLAGLGLGAILGSIIVAPGQNARRVLARFLLGAAFLCVAPLGLAALLPMAGAGISVSISSTPSTPSAALLIVPGAAGCGLVLPLIARVALSGREQIGKQSGTLIAILAAAWGVGLGLLAPIALAAAGSGTIVFLAGALMLLAGTGVAFGRGLREWVPAGATALLTVSVLLTGGPRAGSGAPVEQDTDGAVVRLLAQREGTDAVFSVTEQLADGSRRLYRDGVSAAPEGRYASTYRVLAHLPALIHPGAERILVLDFGTGTVAGGFTAHESVNSIDCLDAEQTVFDLAPNFEAENRKLLAHAGFRPHAEPVRPFLRRRSAAFDVIVCEPRDAAGMTGALRFTESFYALARGSIAEGGLFCQKLPDDQWSVAALRRTVQAADASFEYVSLWQISGGLVLLAGDRAPSVKPESFLLRIAKNASELQEVHVGDPAHFLAAYVCDGKTFAGASAGSDTAEPLRDGEAGDVHPVDAESSRRELLSLIATCSASSGPEWAAGTYEALPAAAARAKKLRALQADENASTAQFVALADESRGDLCVRAAADERLYRDAVAQEDWASAARLTLARDRTAALRAMADSLEGDRQHYYEVLLLRAGGLPSGAALGRLAKSLSGPEQRFVANRARALRGEPLEAGDERMPVVALRDPTAALEAGDEDQLREVLLDAECGAVGAGFDKAVWAWWKESNDQRGATLMLHRVGWRHALRAARRVVGKGVPHDLIALAPVFAAAYPADATWERQCGDRDEAIRAAAAEAARGNGSRAHVPQLVKMCSDPSQAVRTGAFVSLEGIVGTAMSETGFDPAAPTPESLARVAAAAR
jgi:spermidine synthase